MSELSNLKDDASRAFADDLKTRCPHVLSCKCWQNARMKAWLVVDSLIGQGWTLNRPGSDA